MKTFAFERWCDRLELPTTTRDFLHRLRSSPPARRVQGRLLNVCGTDASGKIGVSIQFESHTVELWAIYTMEYDRAVLEFFDRQTAEAQALLRASKSSVVTAHRDGANPTTLHANTSLDWNGKRWTLLNLDETTTMLLPEERVVQFDISV